MYVYMYNNNEIVEVKWLNELLLLIRSVGVRILGSSHTFL